jgi:copper chaperone CopZ
MPTELTVNGMTCQGCEQVVEEALQMVDGVESAEADRYEDVAVIEGDTDLDADMLVERVEMAGYEGSA